jgi:hypothetical protein
VAELLEYLIRVRGGAQGKREADQAAEGFDNLAGAATRAKIASAGTVPSVNQLSGRLQILGAAAVFAGPSLIALGSSAGAAAAGGAAVAGGGVAALTVGLAGSSAWRRRRSRTQKKVKTAFDATGADDEAVRRGLRSGTHGVAEAERGLCRCSAGRCARRDPRAGTRSGSRGAP